jgi:hypothetical protein
VSLSHTIWERAMHDRMKGTWRSTSSIRRRSPSDRSSRCGRWSAIVLVISAALALVLGSSADTAGGATPTGLKASVSYLAKACSPAPDRASTPKAVTAGTLVLRRGGRTVRLSLVPGGTNPARFTLPGSGRIRATLELQTPRVRVTDGAGLVRTIPLRAQIARNGRVSFSVRGDDNQADVNALIQVQRGARLAAVTAPRQLRRVTLRVLHGPPPVGEGQVFFDAPTTIKVASEGSFDPRWEPTPLVHEYGHFVLHELNAEGPDGGDHQINTSYPTQPTLAWNEGFSTAFAALVLKEGGGLLNFACGPYSNLAVQPARPELASDVDRRYAQYNETRVAGATYQLVGRLGGGERGLKRLLGAFNTYRRDGHSVWTARDLRDLVVRSFERSGADHTTFDLVFRGQGIAWDRSINVGVPGTDPELAKLAQAGITMTVRVSGPAGFDCRTTTDIDPGVNQLVDGPALVIGEKRADGGIAFSNADDCYLSTGTTLVDFVKGHTFGGDSATIPFPYLSGGGHWSGPYTVYATYSCEFEPTSDPAVRYCPTGMQVLVTGTNFALMINAPSVRDAPLLLPRGVETQVGTFTAKGDCTVAALDCGV